MTAVVTATTTALMFDTMETKSQIQKGKRKAEESNPLLDAAAAAAASTSKRVKKDVVKFASAKRKLNHEETDAGPSSSSQPLKKLKLVRTATPSDVEVEKDVRAMDDEVDKLRRLSRARAIIEPSLVATTTTTPFLSTPGSRRKKGETPKETPSGHWRKSSGRGKRVSTSGVITQPHNSVSESSFYKHIDGDLPDIERIRQLLIWCSLRTLAFPNPGLNGEGLELLKLAQEDVVRKLAEKKMDLTGSGSRETEGEVGKNEQNERNRKWEVLYTNDIQRAQAEEEEWKKASYEYEGYGKKLQGSVEERMKGKGKRQEEYEGIFLEGHLLAKSVVGGRGKTRTGMDRAEMEKEIKKEMGSLEYRVDEVMTRTCAAKMTTDVVERMLDDKFGLITSRRVDTTDVIRALTRVDSEQRGRIPRI